MLPLYLFFKTISQERRDGKIQYESWSEFERATIFFILRKSSNNSDS